MIEQSELSSRSYTAIRCADEALANIKAACDATGGYAMGAAADMGETWAADVRRETDRAQELYDDDDNLVGSSITGAENLVRMLWDLSAEVEQIAATNPCLALITSPNRGTR